jgi:regulator of RNase E activity RraA
VLVVDLFGKIRYGTIAGDNLSTAIFTKSHNGLIVNGAVRDVTGINRFRVSRFTFAASILPRWRMSC